MKALAPVSSFEEPAREVASPRGRSVLHRRMHLAISAVFIAGFLWFGARNIAPLGKPAAIGPFHTTDTYIEFITGTPSASERLLKIFSALPADQPIAVVYRDGETADGLLLFIIKYLSWPRPVHAVALRGDNAPEELATLHQRSESAIFFCAVTPPADLPDALRIGRGFSVVVRTQPPNQPAR